MSSQNTKKSMAKIVAAMLVGTVGTGFYGVDAAGLAGSYVGIGTAPTEDRVVKSGTEYKDSDIVGSKYLVDYRQTTNAQGNTFERIPANDNKNGEGVDGTSTANDSRNGVGTTAIGLGTYAARDYATAVGTYTSAISGSTSVGSGAYASQYSAAFGRNTYANSKGVAVGDGARAANGLAIGTGATAGEFYKYIQSDGTQNYGAIINSIAIGPNASAVGGTAIGAKAQTNSLYGVALGQNSKVSYNGVALGVNAQVTAKGNGGIALGTSSVANRGAGTIGYMPLVDGVKGEVAANDSRLAEVMGLSDDIKNFTTQYATEISEYNQLNKNYSEIDAKKEEQKNIMIATKGNDDAAYQAAKTEYDKLSKDAVAATNARNAWTAAHQEFTQAMAEQQSALAVFKATDGAVSVGSDAYVDAKTGKTIQNTRQIINVAAGTEDTDAVNVAQLKAVANVVDDKMSDFTVGADKAAQKDGITVDATDENKRFDIVGADDNITTNVDGRTITVGLGNNLNLTNAGSVQFGSATTDTKLDTTGLTVNNTTNPGIDLKFTSSGISAGNQVVENVKSDIADEAGDTYLTKLSTANGNNPNSAVNVSDLQSTASALDTKITKAGDDITTINTNIGKLQAGFNVAAGTNTSSVALGGDTAPTITFAGDANVTAALDKATNTVTYTLNKDGITTTLGDTFAKVDASNLQGDTTNIDKWKTVLGVTDTALGQASAWKLQVNGKDESTISKDSVVNFVNGTGIDITKANNDITVGLDKTTQDKIDNASGDVTKLQAGFNVAVGTNTSSVALGGDTAPTITFAGDENVKPELSGTTVTYKLDKTGIITTLGDTFTKVDASNLQGDTTNINNWKTVLGITDTALGQASAWKLQANGENESIISKDSVVNFVNGTSTEVTKNDNTITVDLNEATKNQISNNTKAIGDIKNDVTKINNKIDNIVTNDGNLNIQGDDATGVVVGAADANDPKKGLKVSLGDTIKVGDITLSGKDGNSTLTGLSNTTWDESNFQADRAATEGQLKDFMGKINDNVTPTKFKDDDNIHVKEISKNNFEISLDENLKVENSISVGGDTYISKEGINANDKVITNVGESKLEAGSKNAATVNQVVEVRDELNETIGNVAGAVQDNMRQMAKLDDRMNKVGAGAAALAGLHPLEFNPDDKFSAAVAMGSYKGQGAAALGGFYRPNADTMFSVSSTLGDETMFNIGVSLKFGQKGDDVYRNPNNTSFRDLTNEVASLKEENKALNDKMTEKEKSFEATNKALNDKVTAQQVELEQQRALIQQLMAKVGM